MKNKFLAKKTTCSSGHIHDSKKEANRCDELHLLLKAGEISDLELQRSFVIVPAIFRTIVLNEVYKSGEKKGQYKTKRECEEKQVCYKADFVYFDERLKKTVIEDAKGFRTKDYIIKRKLMKQIYCDDDCVFLET